MTYTYSTGQVSHFALKMVETSCHHDKDRTRLIGVMCKTCKHYEGRPSKFMKPSAYLYEATKYVVCNAFEKDDIGPKVSEIRELIYEGIETAALCAL